MPCRIDPLVSAAKLGRRAVAFLRWTEGDADAVAPSLFRSPGAVRRRAAAAPEEEPAFDVAPPLPA